MMTTVLLHRILVRRRVALLTLAAAAALVAGLFLALPGGSAQTTPDPSDAGIPDEPWVASFNVTRGVPDSASMVRAEVVLSTNDTVGRYLVTATESPTPPRNPNVSTAESYISWPSDAAPHDLTETATANLIGLASGTHYFVCIWRFEVISSMHNPVTGETDVVSTVFRGMENNCRSITTTPFAIPALSSVTTDSLTMNWGDISAYNSAFPATLRVGFGAEDTLPDGIDPCSDDDTNYFVCETDITETSYRLTELGTLTSYYVSIYQTLASGTRFKIAGGPVTTGGAIRISGQSATGFTVAWGDNPLATGRTHVRVTSGTVNDLPALTTPCSAADRTYLRCPRANVGTMTTTVSGLAGGFNYHVGVWQQVGSEWIMIDEAQAFTGSERPAAAGTATAIPEYRITAEARAGCGTASVSWRDASPRVTEYRLLYRYDGVGEWELFSIVAPTGADTLAVNIASGRLRQNREVQFRVEANGGIKDGHWGVSGIVTTGSDCNFSFSASTNTEACGAINISWQVPSGDRSSADYPGNSDVNFYVVHFRPVGETAWSEQSISRYIVTADPQDRSAGNHRTSHTITGLRPGVAYELRMTTRSLVGSTHGLSITSDPVDSSAFGCSPSGATATAGTSCGDLAVAWTAPRTATPDYYTINWRLDAEGSEYDPANERHTGRDEVTRTPLFVSGRPLLDADGNQRYRVTTVFQPYQTDYTFAGLPSGASVIVRVTNVGGDGDGMSAESTAAGTVGSTGCDVMDITVTAGFSCDDIYVSWTEVAGADTYVIEWRRNGATAWTHYSDFVLPEFDDSTMTTEQELTGLPPGTELQVRVGVAGEAGSWSDPQTISTLDVDCPVLTFEFFENLPLQPHCGQVSVSWFWTDFADAQADSYFLEWRQGSGSWNTVHLISPWYDYYELYTGLSSGVPIQVRLTTNGGRFSNAPVVSTRGADFSMTGGPANCTPDGFVSPGDFRVLATDGTGCGDVHVRWSELPDSNEYITLWRLAGSNDEWTESSRATDHPEGEVGLPRHLRASGVRMLGLPPGMEVDVAVQIGGFASYLLDLTFESIASATVGGSEGCTPTPEPAPFDIHLAYVVLDQGPAVHPNPDRVISSDPAVPDLPVHLVSNLGLGEETFSVGDTDNALAFRTGPNPSGYLLQDIRVGFSNQTSGIESITAYLATGLPDTEDVVAELSTADGIVADNLAFTAPANTRLSPNTWYFFVMTTPGDRKFIDSTRARGEDASTTAGWSFAESGWWRDIGDTDWMEVLPTDPRTPHILRIGVRAQAYSDLDSCGEVTASWRPVPGATHHYIVAQIESWEYVLDESGNRLTNDDNSLQLDFEHVGQRVYRLDAPFQTNSAGTAWHTLVGLPPNHYITMELHSYVGDRYHDNVSYYSTEIFDTGAYSSGAAGCRPAAAPAEAPVPVRDITLPDDSVGGTSGDDEEEEEVQRPSSIYVPPPFAFPPPLPGPGPTPPPADEPTEPTPTSIRVTLSDSDGLVEPGSTVVATAAVLDESGELFDGDVEYTWTVSGALSFNNADASSAGSFRISIPADTPAGAYTVRVSVAEHNINGAASIRVGETGDAVGGVALALGARGAGGSCELGSLANLPDAATAAPDGEICVTARVLNSRGLPTNDSDVATITVAAAGGAINGGGDEAVFRGTAFAGFEVSRATAGIITVTVTAVSSSGAEVSANSIDLTWQDNAPNHEGAGFDEAGFHCLSQTAEFTVWLCDADADAATFFGLMESAGATAVHRWTGEVWQRYSEVGGFVVPGSQNFQFGRGQVLYVSY